MRNNLGKIFLIILMFLHLDLLASTYEWSAKSNKTKAVTNEPIHLKYICRYSDRAELYNIEFNPVVDNETYTIKLLSETVKIRDWKKISSFEFVVFVKKAGIVEFAFDTIMKKTNEDSIQNTVLGRDNADYEEFSQRIIRQEAISIDVEDSSSNFVGDFKLKIKKDKQKLKAYEAYNLEIDIEGIGSIQNLKAIEFKIDDVKIFTQKPTKNIKLTKDGYIGTWSQKFAFVAKKDFNIPQVSIKYYDIKEKKIKELVIPKAEVKVIQAYEKEELLDADEKPFKLSYDFLYYILTFIAGYLFANIKFKQFKSIDTKDSSFEVKVKGVKSLEELMIILALKDSKKYEEIILDIETKKVTSLSECKKRLLN